MATKRDAVRRGGERALVGWRGWVADAVAAPLARRTPLERDFVRAAVGWSFVVLAVSYLYSFARRMT